MKGKNFLRKGVARLKSHFPHLSIGGEGWELRAERHGPSILPVSVETRALVLRGCRSQLGCCGFPGCRRPCPGQGQLPASNLRDREKPGGQVRKERDSELCRDATAISTVLEVPSCCVSHRAEMTLLIPSPALPSPHDRPVQKHGSSLTVSGDWALLLPRGSSGWCVSLKKGTGSQL